MPAFSADIRKNFNQDRNNLYTFRLISRGHSPLPLLVLQCQNKHLLSISFYHLLCRNFSDKPTLQLCVYIYTYLFRYMPICALHKFITIVIQASIQLYRYHKYGCVSVVPSISFQFLWASILTCHIKKCHNILMLWNES